MEKAAASVSSPSRMEPVLDFCVELSRRMIVSGANLERVVLAIERVCHAYGLHDLSVYLLSTYLSVSARDEQGNYIARQVSIPTVLIHLARLKHLNRLSYRVVAQTPDPDTLWELLEEASAAKDYHDWIILLGQLCAAACLCLIFGGGLRELLPVLLIMAEMHLLARLMEKLSLDRIVCSVITMWAATVTAIGLMALGISSNGTIILITVSMLMIPGIPLVNAVRNLLCGNEMNGILQIFKATTETLALAMGIYLGIILLGQGYATGGELSTVQLPALLLIGLSFLASASFGVVFRIPWKDLWLAGLGGALTRIALIVLGTRLSSRMLYVTVAALLASLYAELLATKRKDPSTYFLYPAIIPLIPGDLFYYAIEGLYAGNWTMLTENGCNCLLTLLAMSIGFVLSSIIAHYTRRMRNRKLIRLPGKTSAIHNSHAESQS